MAAAADDDSLSDCSERTIDIVPSKRRSDSTRRASVGTPPSERRGAKESAPSAGPSTTLYSGALIALVPDPVRSHLNESFDAELDALYRAFEREKYSPVGAWLPWLKDSVGKRLDDEPVGVVVFRHEEEHGVASVRLLFLVGETPGAGAKPAELRAALRVVRDLDAASAIGSLRPATGHSPWTTYRVVGPAFSGGAFVLHAALVGVLRPADRAVVVSGSATGDAVPSGVVGSSRQIVFRRTVHSEAALRDAFRTFITEDLNVPLVRTAWLYEATTAYGRSALTTQDTTGELLIPFPMNIASDRVVHGTMGGGDDGSVHLGTSATGLYAPLEWEKENATLGDEPHSTATDLTPAAVDLMLSDISRALVVSRIRYAVITATDIRDKLFLATAIRRRTRDVQFVSLDGNVLYNHPDAADALHGMLVLSTYPMTMQSQWWEGNTTKRVIFASEAAEGVYNATLAQLGDLGALVDYAPPFVAVRSEGGEPSAINQIPPVWLSVIGSDGALPVNVTSEEIRCKTCTRVGAPLSAGLVWLAQRAPPYCVVFAMSLTLLGALAWWAWTSIRLDRLGAYGRSSRSTRFLSAWHWTPGLSTRRAAFRTTGVAAAVLMLVAVPPVYYPSSPGSDNVRHALSLAMLAAAMVPLVLAVARLAGCVWATPEVDPFAGNATSNPSVRHGSVARNSVPDNCVRFAIAVAVACYAVVGLWLLVGAFRRDDSAGGMFLFRFGALTSGVSPSLPLLIASAGLLGWALWHDRQAQDLQGPTPFEIAHIEGRRGRSLSGDDRAKWIQQLRSLLTRPVPGFGFAWVVAPVTIWMLWPTGSPPSFERATFAHPGVITSFDALLLLGGLGVALVLLWGVARLIMVWRAYERTLNCIARTPLRTSVSRLPADLSRLTRLTLLTGQPLGRISSDIRRQIVQLERAAAWVGSQVGEHPLALIPEPADARGDAYNVCALFQRLNEAWKREPDAEALSKTHDALAPAAMSVQRAALEQLAPVAELYRINAASKDRLWLRQAEEIAALYLLDYVAFVNRLMSRSMVMLFSTLVVGALFVSSYPIAMQDALKTRFFCVALVAVGTIIGILIAMDRNELLSRIAHTDPGRIDWDASFVMNLVTVLAVPTITLLSWAFPSVRALLFGWVEPLAHTIRK